LVAAWSVLELVTVSLHQIGSAHAVASDQGGRQTIEQRRHMLEALDAFFSPELLRQMAQARRTLGEYLSDDEAESISDRLDYWSDRTSKQA